MGKKTARKMRQRAYLRDRAEELLQASAESVDALPAENLQALIHELKVHQIELEIQNEELRQTQLELAESRDRFNDLYDFAPVGYVTLDFKGAIVEANLTAARMLGASRGHLLRRKFRRFVARESQDIFHLHCRQVFSSEQSASCELLLKSADGNSMAVQLESIAFRRPSSQARQCHVALVDINERKLNEEQLRQTQERLQLALESARMGTWAWDVVNNLAYWDKRLFELLGLPDQQNPIDAGMFFERVFPEDIPALRKRFEKAVRTHRDFYHEYRIICPDGEVRWLAAKGRLVKKDSLGLQQMFGVSFDITDRKKLEADLKELNLRLEQRVEERTAEAEARANQVRILAAELARTEQRERDHLAEILHDHLQQLLVAIKMRLAALMKASSESKRAQLEAGMRDLLVQSIEATRSLSVQLSPPALREKGLVAAFEWLAHHMEITHKLKVHLECDQAAQPAAEAIQLLCYQAARELLFNVVKHAGVDQARLEMRAAGDGQLNIVVADQGAGFDLQQYRRQLSSHQNFGLSNIKQRLQIVGGDMSIESSLNRGTTVRLWVPRRLAAGHKWRAGDELTVAASLPLPIELPRSARIISRKRRIRILLADDHRIMREGLAEALTSHADIEIVGEAGDGNAAVDLADKLKPDVILMDVSMPHCDGIQATRKICQDQPGIIVIGLSMHEEAAMRQPMLDAGAVSFISKAAPLQDLVGTILYFMRPRHIPARRRQKCF